LFVCIICVFKYISEKEKSGYGAEPNKLYGTFVSSSEKKTEPEKPPVISFNVNEFENKPLFPPPPPLLLQLCYLWAYYLQKVDQQH